MWQNVAGDEKGKITGSHLFWAEDLQEKCECLEWAVIVPLFVWSELKDQSWFGSPRVTTCM